METGLSDTAASDGCFSPVFFPCRTRLVAAKRFWYMSRFLKMVCAVLKVEYAKKIVLVLNHRDKHVLLCTWKLHLTCGALRCESDIGDSYASLNVLLKFFLATFDFP